MTPKEKQERFDLCVRDINELAKHLSPSRSNGRVEEFAKALPGIYALHGLTSQDYLSMINPSRVGRV